MVKKMAKESEKSLTDKQVFESPEMAAYCADIAATVLRGKAEPVRITIVYDPTSTETAKTNGRFVFINAAHPVFSRYDAPENRFAAVLGGLFHELCHILFCDFAGESNFLATIKDDGKIGYCSDNTLDEVKADMEHNPAYCKLALELYSQLLNIVDDPHDEDKGISEIHGALEQGIWLIRESLFSRVGVAEAQWTNDETGEPILKQSALNVFYSDILQYARFHQVHKLDYDYSDFILEMVDSVKPNIDNARMTDDTVERIQFLHPVVAAIWPWVKESVKDEESTSKKSESDSIENTISQMSQTFNAMSTRKPENCKTSSTTSRNQRERRTQNQNGPANPNAQQDNEPDTPRRSSGCDSGSGSLKDGDAQNGNQEGSQQGPDDNSGDGSQASGGQSDGSQRNSDDISVNNAKASDCREGEQIEEQQGQHSGRYECGGQSIPRLGNPEPVPSEAIKEVLSAIKRNCGQRMAEDSAQQQLTSDLNTEINAVNQAGPHTNKTVSVYRELNVSQKDISLYETQMSDLKLLSSRMQRKMMQLLEDYMQGEINTRLAFGEKLIAKDTYHIDGKFFANEKMPEDRPEMAICVLVDQSGSMHGERLRSAMKATMLLYDFASGIGIPIHIAGHNTSDTGINYFVYSDYNSVDKHDKYRIAQMTAYNANRDGMAIEIAANLLSRRPELSKLMIVVSDGQPSDYDYGGALAAADISSIVKKYRKTGVEIIASAIGSDKDRIKAIYGEGNFLDISDLNTFPKALLNLVKKKVLSAM